MDKPKNYELRAMHATLCQAIADPTRIALLYELGDGRKHVSQLVDSLQLPQATVSRHLKILRDRSLVVTEREGTFVYYSLVYPEVLAALDLMRSVMHTNLSEQSSLANAVYFSQGEG